MTAVEMFDLTGQAAFVSGAAGGLGFAMAEVLAENGAGVMMTDIDVRKLDKSAELLAKRGLKIDTLELDVANLGAIESTIETAAKKFGRLDIVCANAGLSAGPGPLTPTGGMAQVDLKRWDELLRINLTSVFVTIRAASAQMRPRKYGRIIVTSSVAGLRGERLCGYGYVAAKAAISNLVRQSALELASDNVTINAVAPGPFLTNIGGGRLKEPEVASLFVKEVPMNRIGTPDEIQGLVLLLASKASSFMTGTVIPIDGGASAS
ncbi:SDR family NAD(P)-dependent oxidoreductase [Bradyrhizobium canariense]|uniref:SDR family NAD(P)-dependent oxidoreductase n=1 Tax=Bradyrhizobium canariense TaxID=255045 RepID=UPI0018D4B4A8|nr:SDR family NAD(P)-dependent oxidoreductase [Bradyrhizobium canariense]